MKPLVGLTVPLVLQIVRKVVSSECESHWMFFNHFAEEDSSHSRMVEKYGSVSGMKDYLIYVGVDVLIIVTGTVISAYKAKAHSDKKSNNLVHGFEQINQAFQGKMLFEFRASMKIGWRMHQHGGEGRSSPGRGQIRSQGQIW